MKVITLMGADASGKDTQVALLKKHFEDQHKKVQIITVWDSLAEFSSVTPDKKTVQAIIETFLLKYEAHARSFFLMASLKNSLSKINPSSDIVFLNGFYEKYWASEMAYGVESEFWEKNNSAFVPSQKIIYLKTPVEVCMKRKTSWSKYEQGLAQFVDPKKSVPREVFQQNLHHHLDKIAKGIDHLITIDGSNSVEEVFGHLLKEI